MKQSLCHHFSLPSGHSRQRANFTVFRIEDSALSDINPDFPVLQNMPIFAGEMVRPCKGIDNVLQQICQRLRKLEKSDSEKTEERRLDV